MFTKLVLVFSVLGTLGYYKVSAQILQDGQCDSAITLQANFAPEQFIGSWYEVARSGAGGTNVGACSSWEIATATNGYTFTYNSVEKNFAETVNAQGSLETGTARFSLNYGGTENEDFWILGTNYLNYALGYRCENVGTTQRNIYVTLLGRSTTIDAIFTNVLNNLVSGLGITIGDLIEIDHSEAACLTLLVYASDEPVILEGQCNPNISLLANFDAGRFLGTWNEIYSYYSENAPGTCSRAQYSASVSGVLVANSQVVDQTLVTINGVAVVSDAAAAKLTVTLEVIPGVFAEQDLWIIDTDYENYAISYSCIDLSENTKRVFSWIASRQKTLSTASQEAVNTVVDSILDLNFAYYQEEDHSKEACFYYPPFSADTMVQFPGDCDLGIPAVANFDAERYMGLWHDIASYPSGFQEGTCSNAFYSLNEVVHVYNTQVINQTLDTITGTAVPVSTDGSAKLEVTFPVAGTDLFIQSPYWVLAADYDSYALVYTCYYNEATDLRTVFSWKLSREKTLSDEANTAINNVIAEVPVLDDRYFITRDQSPEGCFYFPEPQEGVPVVYPGQCDESIAAVSNFDLSQFQGTWYEIETYPKDESGECVRHEYSEGNGNTLNIASSFLVNDFPGSSASVLEYASANDSSAKFVMTINTESAEVVIPFWVLSVDYNDYALAYSCVNHYNDYRTVYSWKLSRNATQLSENAQTQITNVIDTIDVLDERYFVAVQQDEIECIPLPDIPEGESIILEGQCNQNIPVVQNFDAGRYVGPWHLIESYPSEFQNGTCIDANYIAQADGSVLVVNTQVLDQQLDTITGVATIASTDGSAKLLVTFPDGQSPFPVEYWVIDTDYDSYSLVYSCVDLSDNRQQIWSWKMSRAKSLTEEAINNIARSIENIRVLNEKYYYKVDNSDEACFYYPVADGTPVIYRGQCDESIPVVLNFDPESYMGLWYDIESYPQPFQDGSCATATYALVDGGVDVFNTQVVNQTLDTILGRAFLVDSENVEAKLDVYFPIAGIDVYSPYWVLATDYNNYALVYACQNIGNDSRSVSSWKLSRTRTLTDLSQLEINSVISSIDVLRQDYYEIKGHTDEQCFYYPEPTGDPVVFRGECDDFVQAMANFDLERFAGQWYEIQTYPKDQAGGQCISHEFAFNVTSEEVLQLISNQVFNSETLVSNEGQIVLSSTDGSGRFTLTINTAEGVITMPYWILDTDYTEYALVYSCMARVTEDMTMDSRAVYSWKLSRSQQLSTAANTAINTVMANVDVLQQQYFQDVTQTDAACFYLPEIGLNEPVIFTGQCDPNVSVKANFEPSRFEGRWFDIESYFDEYNGACIDGNFTTTASGYDVRFTQVVDQTLYETLSSATLAADNSGKLIVSSNGATFEYWILDTDYENWALLYSCDNVGTTQRRVRSWKMSRTRSLSNESNTAINAIVENVDVLNERFYNTRDHSEAACFYYPVPDGNPVTFRGRCDMNIPVVQNFDVAAYLDQWYDIQSYPQAFQDGECATALYTLGENGVDVYNTQVVNQQLDTINGFAVPSSDDGDAKLNVTFIVNGFELVSPYWVLATDYTSYSLVYSCSEIDEEYKRVSAWKLSRTRALSEAAEQTINQIMSTIPELDQRYFRQVGHSDEACFFYPDNNGGPVILNGQCPSANDVQAVNSFNVDLFDGVWHEVSRFPSEQVGECASSEYTVQSSTVMTIRERLVANEVLSSSEVTSTISNDGRGIFSVGELNMFVLYTDYSEFALLYACENQDNSRKRIYSWKLSRSRNGLSQNAVERIDAIVSTNEDLFELYYEPISQTDDACFHYPDFEELPAFIELPGPCSVHNVIGKANFDAEAYLGRWFEISRYPQPDQVGMCAQATYSLGDDVVDVYNTEVVDRSLLVQEGYAVVASTDGSGELLVTFDVGGIIFNASYIIVDTDYSSYSLVYSCRDLDNGNSQVFSWKLSRDRILSAEASQAVNDTIANTRGLREDYYAITSQSDDDCFYVPEPNPNEYVKFRGQCGNVEAMQNFDSQRFLGLWHEVERYPTGQNDGECISSNYQTSGNTIEVVDTAVFGDSASIATTTVTISSDGRITRGGSDLWVLDTDYTSYAILLSCENIDDEYRRVWSAKHSRTRNLPEEAVSAIDQVLANNVLLYQQFYMEVDQSDSGCFYYPEVTGQPVVLPGQCDDNIPVVRDFSLEKYTGTWYHIERYPPEHEVGTCAGHRYSLNEESGGMTVLSWEVIDGELVSVEGTATPKSDDGSARFWVVRNSGDDEEERQTSMYVLVTDYTSYALAYSCENINIYQRQVGVWKLSRTRSMLEEGTNMIDIIMSPREELDQRYFVPVEHNEDCEEPSSSYLIKSSFTLLIICSILQKLS